MTTYEGAYLVLVIAAFLVFGATLFTVDRWNYKILPAKARRK